MDRDDFVPGYVYRDKDTGVTIIKDNKLRTYLAYEWITEQGTIDKENPHAAAFCETKNKFKIIIGQFKKISSSCQDLQLLKIMPEEEFDRKFKSEKTAKI